MQTLSDGESVFRYDAFISCRHAGEINTFIALGKRGYILTILIDGKSKTSLPGQLRIAKRRAGICLSKTTRPN
ncbi:MAG: hypothetical protein LBS91_04140 [Clostridiales Family XIII bacterium]|jgi:hypothetical protein|nr:hypothetical protein [Clostridiales Family XIII bacterium]